MPRHRLLLAALVMWFAIGSASDVRAHGSASGRTVDQYARAQIVRLTAESVELRRENEHLRAELDQLLERTAALEVEVVLARDARRVPIDHADSAERLR